MATVEEIRSGTTEQLQEALRHIVDYDRDEATAIANEAAYRLGVCVAAVTNGFSREDVAGMVLRSHGVMSCRGRFKTDYLAAGALRIADLILSRDLPAIEAAAFFGDQLSNRIGEETEGGLDWLVLKFLEHLQTPLVQETMTAIQQVIAAEKAAFEEATKDLLPPGTLVVDPESGTNVTVVTDGKNDAPPVVDNDPNKDKKPDTPQTESDKKHEADSDKKPDANPGQKPGDKVDANDIKTDGSDNKTEGDDKADADNKSDQNADQPLVDDVLVLDLKAIDKKYRDALIAAGVTTAKAILAHNDLASLTGLGDVSAGRAKDAAQKALDELAAKKAEAEKANPPA